MNQSNWELAEDDPPRPLPDEGDLRAAFRRCETMFAPALSSRLVELSLRLVDGIPRVCLLPGGHVGFVSLGQQSLHVRPKLRGANWLALAAMAGELGGVRWQDVPPSLGDTSDPSMPQLLRASFARAAEDFLRTGPRRLHGARQEVLRGRVRGRPLVPALLREVAAGRLDRVPCEFAAHRLDNPPNRVLREAARRMRLLGPHPVLDRLEGHLADAGPLQSSDLRSCNRLPGHFAHSRDLLGLASLVLRRLSLADRPGSTPSVSLSLSLPEVFERAFQREARRVDANVQPSPEWPLHLDEEWFGTMIPDVHAPADERRPLVVDLKWKMSLERGEANNPDLYQAAAYAQAARGIAVLVYPSAQEGPPRTVRPFGNVFVAPWKVVGDPAASFRVLWHTISRLRGEHRPVARDPESNVSATRIPA